MKQQLKQVKTIKVEVFFGIRRTLVVKDCCCTYTVKFKFKKLNLKN